jgi:hypothetical protein
LSWRQVSSGMCFIRVQSGNAVMIAARLWQKEEFYADSQKIDLVNGLQFGAIFFVFPSIHCCGLLVHGIEFSFIFLLQ